ERPACARFRPPARKTGKIEHLWKRIKPKWIEKHQNRAFYSKIHRNMKFTPEEQLVLVVILFCV
ncbi:MAG: hypothetical protein OXF46_05155, partial [Rhodobacteraceae bacterium]|nr:hypothetical protein [Paracoccaceae bacterium]